jgi:hypothetical protein
MLELHHITLVVAEALQKVKVMQSALEALVAVVPVQLQVEQQVLVE